MRYFITIMIVLFITGGITAALLMTKTKTEKRTPAIKARSVRVITAELSNVVLKINSQGTVKAKQAISLIPQVSGEIIYVSDRFTAGGKFKKGEVILKLDPRDYKFEIITSQALVNEAVQNLTREKEESSLAKQEWDSLGEGKASALTLRLPQLEAAQARLDSANANLNKAKLRLERSIIKAPFAGIISQKNVDFGQYINSGTRVATYHSTDVLEIRLPLSSRDLKKFDLKALRSGSSDIDVTFSSAEGSQSMTWNAKIIRTEGLIDPASRILYVVSEIKGSELKSVKSQEHINIGQFVSAVVEGKHLDQKFKLPREALRQNNIILIVDKDNKIRTKRVQVLESRRDYIIVGEGLKEGDIICLSQIGVGSDGLLVKPERVKSKYAHSGTSSVKEAAHE